MRREEEVRGVGEGGGGEVRWVAEDVSGDVE